MKIKTCPNCGSTDIEIDPLMGITGNAYKCKTCGYTGQLIIEQDVDRIAKK